MKMPGKPRISRYTGIVISVLGLVVNAPGVYFVAEGFVAMSEVQAALAEEQLTVTIDEVKVPVADQEIATAMADVIKGHTLGRYGPWQGMERDDPNRATILDGLALRNSLTLARMALDVSDLVTGLGAALALIGAGFTATGAVIVGFAGQNGPINNEPKNQRTAPPDLRRGGSGLMGGSASWRDQVRAF